MTATRPRLKAAAAFACEYQANLWLVQAIETPPATLEIDFSVYRKDLADAADFGLHGLKGRLDINAPHAVIDGAVADALREEAVGGRQT